MHCKANSDGHQKSVFHLTNLPIKLYFLVDLNTFYSTLSTEKVCQEAVTLFLMKYKE